MHAPIASQTLPVNASGGNLRRLLRGRPAPIRAQIAGKLVSGEFLLVRPLPAQAARLCAVSPARVARALGLPPRPRSDAEVDRIVAKLGADRVLAAIDRATAPNR